MRIEGRVDAKVYHDVKKMSSRAVCVIVPCVGHFNSKNLLSPQACPCVSILLSPVTACFPRCSSRSTTASSFGSSPFDGSVASSGRSKSADKIRHVSFATHRQIGGL